MYFPVYYALDLAATGLLALAAACRATSYGLHLTGAVALGCLAGLASPILRDVLLGFGAVGPLQDNAYAALALAGALTGCALGRWRTRAAQIFFWSDALALGLASSMGASRGVVLGLGPVGCILLGLCAGTAGGVARDVCLGDVPQALEGEFYVTASAMGCMVVLALAHLLAPGPVQVLAATALVAALRRVGQTRAALNTA